MDADRLAQIRARADAATPGPWRWTGNTDAHSMYLSGMGRGRPIVMAFKRWGMSSAQPVFAAGRERAPDGAIVSHGILTPAVEMVRYEVAPAATSRQDAGVYRADLSGIRHPDAEFVAHARDDVSALLAEVERLTALTATCCCGTSPMTYEGPEPECPVHGAVRAFNEATREIARLTADLERVVAHGVLGVLWRDPTTGKQRVLAPQDVSILWDPPSEVPDAEV